MKVVKPITRFIISFILMFIFLALQLSVFTSLRLTNASFYKANLDKSNYFNELSADISKDLKSYSSEANIDDKVLTSAVSDENLKSITYKNIDETVAMLTSNYNKSNKTDVYFSSTLKGSLESYIKSKGMELTTEMKGNINTIISDTTDIVSEKVNFLDVKTLSEKGSVQKLASVISKVNVIIVTLIVVSVILILAIFIIDKNRRETFLWVGSSSVAASLFTVITSLYVILNKIPYRIAIDSQYLVTAIGSILTSMSIFVLIIGLILLLVGIILLASWFRIEA